MTIYLICAKCNGEMQEGLVVDFNDAGLIPSMWVEDRAEKRDEAGNMMNGRKKVRTTTYRCSNCGYLDADAK